MPYKKKIEFFIETRHAVGRTALMLSGGGILGLYHIGVIKVMWECNVLPKIICGSSSGSIIASYICVTKDEDFEKVKYNLIIIRYLILVILIMGHSNKSHINYHYGINLKTF